ncbi:hypothetical protein UFOVP658_52 [uncultured Caudovirales phage]|uniref:Uncharacterized protein n=1 Tax=uncultured Caudovirales phage TaxID=2100421 RepID=A0A6J5NLW0_9CAUD|nr:hypothetical protein UFOVP658_52 [uncultured Caudovirales phage]
MKTTHITHADMTLDKMTDTEIRQSLEAILWALELVDGSWSETQATVRLLVKQAHNAMIGR